MQGSRYNKSEHNGNFIVGGVVVGWDFGFFLVVLLFLEGFLLSWPAHFAFLAFFAFPEVFCF